MEITSATFILFFESNSQTPVSMIWKQFKIQHYGKSQDRDSQDLTAKSKTIGHISEGEQSQRGKKERKKSETQNYLSNKQSVPSTLHALVIVSSHMQVHTQLWSYYACFWWKSHRSLIRWHHSHLWLHHSSEKWHRSHESLLTSLTHSSDYIIFFSDEMIQISCDPDDTHTHTSDSITYVWSNDTGLMCHWRHHTYLWPYHTGVTVHHWWHKTGL